MKTVAQFWKGLNELRLYGHQLPNDFAREVQSLVLEGIEALPEIELKDQAKPGGITRIPEGVAIESMIGVAGGVTGFKFGAKSLKELTGVNPDLVRCAGLALTKYSRVDYTVYDGIRNKTEQAHYVKIGTSKTMKSKHLDGLAVDLVPIIGGIPKWDWTGCYEIAFAMDQAATELGMADRITWGGCWDKTLDEYGGSASQYIAAVEAYKVRHNGPDFIDGPHFEIRS